MAELTDPERRDGGTSHAGGKHQAAGKDQAQGAVPAQGTARSGGKHAAVAGRRAESASRASRPGKASQGGGGKHQAAGRGQPGPKRQAGGRPATRGKHAAPAPAATATETTSQSSGLRSTMLALPRRKVLISGGALAAAFAGLDALRNLAATPVRLAAGPATADLAKAHASPDPRLPDIQFDLSQFSPPAVTVNGVLVSFPPVFTIFATAQLASTPSKDDQDALADALDRVEKAYQFAPQGVFTFVAYGLPYFNRFPSKVFDAKVPRLLSDQARFALEEAVPSPTDVSPANPGITKQRFNVPVQIEANDLLFTLRSDNVDNLWDVLAFLGGSNMLAGQKVPSPRLSCGLTFTGTRVMFAQRGLPRSVADQNSLVFAPLVHPSSPMWMGFADQQVDASAPAADVTFAGADGIHFTTAKPGDYFDSGSLQHLSHVILDMQQWFDLSAAKPGDDGTFLEHVQYMFRADPPPFRGYKNQFLNAGGPAFVPNVFQGFGDAAKSAAGIGTLPDETTGLPEHRMGHISCLQRSSRTADGRPIHVRMDGPGFDSMDVPDGTKQPKLEFTVFVPSADFFATMRRNQASLDLAAKFNVVETNNGLERFITATRRQNFLIPPRRHRAFPFAELGGDPGTASAAKRSNASSSRPSPSSSSSGGSTSGGSGSGGSGSGSGSGGSGSGSGGSGSGGSGSGGSGSGSGGSGSGGSGSGGSGSGGSGHHGGGHGGGR